jgi:hypothetical protein
MTRKKWRRLRADLSFLIGIALTVLVLAAVLTGTGVGEGAGEAVGLEDTEDWHAAVGYTMGVLACLHVILCLGSMKTYAVRRLRELRRSAIASDPSADRAQSVHQEHTTT